MVHHKRLSTSEDVSSLMRYIKILSYIASSIIPTTASTSPGECSLKDAFVYDWTESIKSESSQVKRISAVAMASYTAVMIRKDHFLYGSFGGTCLHARASKLIEKVSSVFYGKWLKTDSHFWK